MTTPALLGTLLDGKFQVEKMLGSGASGDVYEALHLGLGAHVAVKVLRPGVPETAEVRRKRFQREARVAARVRSPHVVTVFDIVAPEVGPTYIVMELLQGETLAQRVRRLGRLAIEDAVEYVVQAASALAAMHEAGIVHRDVNPSNIFLARDEDGRERVKLIDFGVAAFREAISIDPKAPSAIKLNAPAESSLTLAEAILGTPRYMAPEQVDASKDVDARTDLWALGVTLYVLVAGSPPFDAETAYGVIHQIVHDEPPLLAGRRADVPAGLAAVVHRCLAKDPASRPVSGRELAALLEPFRAAAGGHDPPPSPAVTPRAHLRALITPRRAAAAVAGAGIAVLAALRIAPSAAPARESAPAPVVASSPPAPVADEARSPPAVARTSAPAVVDPPGRAPDPAPKAAAPRRAPPATSARATPKRPTRWAWENDDRLE